jgi:UDP-sugar transporter A1/2/3
MKYADNILKTFATSISIVLSCILSYTVLGDLNLAPTFVVGTVVIISATALYAFASQSSAQTVKQQDFSPRKIISSAQES